MRSVVLSELRRANSDAPDALALSARAADAMLTDIASCRRSSADALAQLCASSATSRNEAPTCRAFRDARIAEDEKAMPAAAPLAGRARNCVAAAPDGRDHHRLGRLEVKVWRDGGVRAHHPGARRPVMAVAVLPGGARFASGSDDGTAKLWTLDGALERTFEVGALPCVTALPDGVHFVVGTRRSGKEVRLYHVDGTLVHTFKGHAHDVYAVAVTPDGQHIISGSEDRPSRCGASPPRAS